MVWQDRRESIWPRRFGKSMAAKMLAAYYSKGSNSAAMLSGRFSNYWSKIENYEALKVYLEMDFGFPWSL